MRYFSYNMMYYRISKNEKILFFGKQIAQVWAVTLSKSNFSHIYKEKMPVSFYDQDSKQLITNHKQKKWVHKRYADNVLFVN